VVHHVFAVARARAFLVTRASAALLAASLAAGLVLGQPPSRATAADVQTAPVDWTPYLPPVPANQSITQMVACGSTMYAVGTATSVARGSQTYARSNAFSFSATTGEMTAWAPAVNGRVRSIAVSPDCRTAYLGGSFTEVNGVPAQNLVAVDTSTGAVRKKFGHTVDGTVYSITYTHGALLVGGGFTTVNGARRIALASLQPRTGKVTRYVRIAIRGALGYNPTMVYGAKVSHDRKRLLIEGNFTSIKGHVRQQAAVLTLGRRSVTLDSWRARELLRACRLPFYVRAGTWSPDDRTIYLATTGNRPKTGPGHRPTQPRSGLCDAVAAFPAAKRSVRHRWINYSGCDSFYAVAADRRRVYVGGHQRWLDNSAGCDSEGPGAVSRPGIGAVDAATGLATSWNPTHSRGHGVSHLLLTGSGLWVASDTWKNGNAQECGGVAGHGGICFFPN
jgi:hypothetical protein